ncbi:MAG: ABC transporter ATP-binding protein [Armatimonadota bacterium]|nr:ABC transporter ATP-binding protein [Armatimonadota bacterium]
MTKPVIEIQNISKRYRIGAGKEPYLSLRDEIAKWLSPAAMRARRAQTELWALKDVNFDVSEGEAVGVIGRNGAGKSTLLKILSKITPPTEGRIVMRGRVASLLEVGTGFHPELTGRENIYLNGAILGMSCKEIARKFDDIAAFAEVERFLDTPVKRYSSGMYVRLAFAVAAHLEPEILVVDEVLAVGDMEFQKKCLGKMGEVARSGRTVLFVSHNMAAISQLCSKGAIIDHGRLDYFGSAQDAVKRYMAAISQRNGSIDLIGPTSNADETSDENTGVRFRRVFLTNASGDVCDTFFIGDEACLCFDVEFTKRVKAAQIGFIIRSVTSGNIYHCVTRDAGFHPTDLFGKITFKATFPRLALYPGQYVLTDLSIDTPTETLEFIQNALYFQVAEGGPQVYRRLSSHAAVVHEVPNWRLERDGFHVEGSSGLQETSGVADPERSDVRVGI